MPEATREFSVQSLENLAVALTAYLAMRSDERRRALGVALAALCGEAHARHLGPGKMVLAAKAVWENLPAASGIDHLRASAAFDSALGACLESYYDSATPSHASLEVPVLRARKH